MLDWGPWKWAPLPITVRKGITSSHSREVRWLALRILKALAVFIFKETVPRGIWLLVFGAWWREASDIGEGHSRFFLQRGVLRHHQGWVGLK